ncbi:thiol:disulfide interchange protein [Vibrio coralliilyticus]|mgnify:CR=1 FL=1|jgi:cytochrome c biogenesis protein CcmG/thiol:disulfide interchange protein DsbE|uniref:Thiol:disulfide interchange protein n=1 Tax=Vibrio coralliilyticus TaxID=190893 RepID=A0A097QLZ2_9VIBR|nr:MULTISPECIES: DsbE family thiol:disulfide interchange protein [Vibrio]AIU67470.1 thiol:disulfide interchange protein [Vibrio coralliilyticus]AIW18219.1 thiol:disulfide interchange protein [Vibrio coralliilyticus]ANW23542.1 thiol:disulfide interchange protein [Vibrio coralliilyticus]ARC91639.1 thiol:disulfide interchange protein [Vibrio coralliilyticus]AXN29819.1 DsbE family thiol:disulfide interchange protein [Vibrio coralliilyticus]
MNKKLLFIPLLAFLGLVAVFATQLVKNSHGDDPTKLESVLVGKSVPEFRLEDLAEPGKLYDQSIFKGEPLLLNVWATWCPTCYAEHQYLNELASQGVKIIGMNYKDERDKAVQWLNELGNPYLISLFDGNGMLGLDLGVYGAPETFLIDAQGKIRYRHVGDVNDRNWNETLKPMYEQVLAEAGQ